MTAEDLTPQEIAAALAARKELGPEYEHAIAASLADRLERRVQDELRARGASPEADDRRTQVDVERAKANGAIGVVSFVAGTVVTITSSGGLHGGTVVGMAWGAVICVNLVTQLTGRRRRS